MSRIINSRIVYEVLSRTLFTISIALLFCGLISLWYSENYLPFIYSFFIALLTGIIFHYLIKDNKGSVLIQRKDAYFSVTLTWLCISLVGSLPYIFSGTIPSFFDALFESVSGFTTTGSSILTDIEILPRSILFWRSLTHWIGGIGFIVLVIVVMPSLQIGGYHLFTLESSLRDKIQPRIKEVGKRLLMIYIFLTVLVTGFLLIGGMNLFESVCHAFGTIATGGFSPKNTSIAGYSPYLQYVIMIFMVLSGTNFVIHYYLLKKQIHKIINNEEYKFFLSIIFITGITITLILFFRMHKPFEESFREGFFQVISIVTCTGYSTADYLQWPAYAWLIIFFTMFLGGSTGSTSGGIKIARHLIVLKNISRNFRQLSFPYAVMNIRLNKRTVSDITNNTILTFISTYLLIFVTGTLVMILIGVDVKTAGGSVATCMAGIGPGIGTVGPASNFAHLPDLAKFLLSFLMIAGRLEIYTVLILFTRNFWSA
jgi:trk system potassium uptake protein